ncbi:hypothetical protein VNI00_006953 [Paramarasmius palmivorus]|uniref:Uncharacterized protein n=1 Tax=Paramarasmius palmivorus TaxID=297713 RepID=A0AAW0D2U2_9AGAR
MFFKKSKISAFKAIFLASMSHVSVLSPAAELTTASVIHSATSRKGGARNFDASEICLSAKPVAPVDSDESFEAGKSSLLTPDFFDFYQLSPDFSNIYRLQKRVVSTQVLPSSNNRTRYEYTMHEEEACSRELYTIVEEDEGKPIRIVKGKSIIIVDDYSDDESEVGTEEVTWRRMYTIIEEDEEEGMYAVSKCVRFVDDSDEESEESAWQGCHFEVVSGKVEEEYDAESDEDESNKQDGLMTFATALKMLASPKSVEFHEVANEWDGVFDENLLPPLEFLTENGKC